MFSLFKRRLYTLLCSKVISLMNYLELMIYLLCPEDMIAVLLYQLNHVFWEIHAPVLLSILLMLLILLNVVVFYQKKSKQQRRQNKLKAYNLSSLLESLPEVRASKKPGRQNDSKLNCKSRQTLVWVFLIIIQYCIANFSFDMYNCICNPLCLFIRLRERDRVSAVLKDPCFQADPLSAIQHYLQKTQPVVEEQPKKKVNKNGSKKKKKSKASTGLQSMEI